MSEYSILAQLKQKPLVKNIHRGSREAIIIFICFLFIVTISKAQVQINELVSSNSFYLDNDGDSPDWFELYNLSNSAISLENWTVTDDENIPDKWKFGNTSIEGNEHLVIWASGKDRNTIATPRTLIDRGDSWRYIIPNQNTSNSWMEKDFSDISWFLATSGFGYADDDDATTISNGTISIFLRKNFTITSVAEIQGLVLDIDYDDSFVAYINGTEVARANINGDKPAYNATSITDHEAQIYSGGKPDRFIVPIDLLVEGQNTIAIQGHNISQNSSDFTLIPFLSAYISGSNPDGNEPADILELSEQSFHTNFKLSVGETLYLFDENGDEVSNLFVENCPSDASIGRRPSDQEVVIYYPPTPEQVNGENGFNGFLLNNIIFSSEGGQVGPLNLTLSNPDPLEVIRYTTDASIPNETSPIYSQPISINENTVIRASVFRDGFLASTSESRTYILNSSHSLPVISLVTEPDNFFSDETGIYVLGEGNFPDFPYFGSNIWEDWERPVHVSIYEPDGTGIKFNAGTKIFGGWSRAQDQRSFTIFARGQYGTPEIDYPLFSNNPYYKYQAFVLRNSGNDFLRSNIRDAALTTLMDGSNIETQRYKSIATYINGEYWGFYNMREKVNEHYLASRHDVNIDDIDLIGPNGELIHGSSEDFESLMDYLEINSLTSITKYNHVADQVDIDNFIMYQLSQIYFGNTDWPGNNMKLWKAKEGKWRWILYDTDFGFGIWNSDAFYNNTLSFALDPSGPDWPNPPSSTLLFRRLIGNLAFRNKFINQFADELNSRFLPDNVEEHIESVALGVASEIQNHYNRWGGDIGFHNSQVEDMKRYGRLRPAQVKSHIRSQFNLPDYHEVTLQVNNPTHGQIKINSLNLDDAFWRGDYFENVPITIKAIPKPGYTFSHWVGAGTTNDPVLVINIQSPTTLTAIFQPSQDEPTVIINEINYNSSDDHDTGDWIELHNPNISPIEISNWTITDSDLAGGFIFAENTILQGGEFLILCKELSKFNQFYDDIENLIGDISFGLSSQGDIVKLYNNEGILLDSVSYLSESPWPEQANGLGNTLELKGPTLDNSLAENWKSINDFGSPGLANTDVTNTVEIAPELKISIFPNPFVDHVDIKFTVTSSDYVNVSLYDILGKKVSEIVDQVLGSGAYSYTENFGQLGAGVYILEVRIGEEVYSYRWVK